MRLTHLVVLSCVLPSVAATQTYPSIPRALPDAEEIALATSAAPAEISERAAVYTIRDGKPTRIREGTNGCTCMVARDLHPGSAYPICYDAEGSRTNFWREIEEVRLRSTGASEDSVATHVADLYRKGTLRYPDKFTVAYMMSPKQVLFSNASKDGRRVGAWWPHLMIMAPGLSGSAMGLRDSSVVTVFSVGEEKHVHELVVKLPSWSDGTPSRP